MDTRCNLLIKYTGKNTYPVLNPLNNKVELSSIQDYFMVDFNVGKKFFKNSLDVVLGIKNIFDIKNLTITGFNGDFHSNSGTNQSNFLWGRTAFLSFNLNLEKND
jgi:outer membrane receptor for ferrienterochelin and colicins